MCAFIIIFWCVGSFNLLHLNGTKDLMMKVAQGLPLTARIWHEKLKGHKYAHEIRDVLFCCRSNTRRNMRFCFKLTQLKCARKKNLTKQEEKIASSSSTHINRYILTVIMWFMRAFIMSNSLLIWKFGGIFSPPTFEKSKSLKVFLLLNFF